jgi:hypothetical protein
MTAGSLGAGSAVTTAAAIAIAAASQAAEATGELLEFARHGPLHANFNFTDEPIEKLAGACKMALEIELASRSLEEAENQLLGALIRFLEGWAG